MALDLACQRSELRYARIESRSDRSDRAARPLRLSQTAGQPAQCEPWFSASATASKQMDPRDALGDLLVDAVVPVLGWPAFYKCAALNLSLIHI